MIQVYVGPSLPDGSLRRMTVFRDGLPKHVQSIIDKNARYGAFFVEPTDIPVATRRIRTNGDALNTLARDLLQTFHVRG